MDTSISPNWGDPQKVQQFRNALIPQIGQQAADDYISKYQSAYQEQAAHQTNATVYKQTAGGITPDQALKDPIATQTFLKGGGQVLDPISSMANAVVNGDMTIGDITSKNADTGAQVAKAIRAQGLDPNRLPNDPQTRSVKASLQAILDTYNHLPTSDKGTLGGILGINPFSAAANYQKQRTGLTESLAPLLGPGKGNGLRLNQDVISNWAELLPKPGQTAEQNQTDLITLDKKMRAVTGQGIDPEYLTKLGVTRTVGQGGKIDYKQQTADKNGGGLLDSAVKDASGLVNGVLGAPAAAIQNGQNIAKRVQAGDRGALAEMNPNGMILNMLKGQVSNYNKDLGEPLKGGDIAGRAVQNFKDRPVSTSLDALSLLALGKGALGKSGGTPTAPSEPNAIQRILAPKSAMNKAGAIRDTAVESLTKAGETVPSSNLVSGLEEWANVAKKGNLGDAKAIDEAVANAREVFKGPQTPQDLADAYKLADSGYTANGIQKSATQALIDRGVRDVISSELDKITKGEWSRGTSALAKNYQSQKSIPAKVVKGLPSRAIGVGMNMTGLGLLGHVLGVGR